MSAIGCSEIMCYRNFSHFRPQITNLVWNKVLILTHLLHNNIGDVGIMQHCGAFAQSLYLPGYPKSLISLQSTGALLWRFGVAGSNKPYLDVHVKCPILTKFGISQQMFIQVRNIKFHLNSSSSGCADTYGLTTSLIPIHSKRALLWRFGVAGSSETNLRLNVKCPDISARF
jgi:hypothetical protein